MCWLPRAFVDLHWLLWALVGLHWPLWAFVGRRGPVLACVGFCGRCQWALVAASSLVHGVVDKTSLISKLDRFRLLKMKSKKRKQTTRTTRCLGHCLILPSVVMVSQIPFVVRGHGRCHLWWFKLLCNLCQAGRSRRVFVVAVVHRYGPRSVYIVCPSTSI